VHPVDEDELAGMLRGATGPLHVQGGGTRALSTGGAFLSTSRLTGIVLYEPGALTLVVRAGTPLAEVEAALAAEGQRLAFEPPDQRGLLGRQGVSTIGGVAAANASGPRRVQAGACRDAMLGVRFMDGTGTVVRNGGRVMKNVTGYDLVRLMAGSRGTLGVLTEVAFRVQAIPEATATLAVPCADADAAVAILSRALGSPFDVTGAAWDGAAALVRVEGMAASVAYRAGRLQADLGGEVAAGADPWPAIRDVAAFHGRPGAVWRISVRPTDGPRVLAGLGMDHRAVLDWGGGLVWLLVDDAGDAGAGVIRPLVAGLGGHATLLRGPAEVPALPPAAPAVAALTAGLKARFDPRGLFS
jgi:glycolate oxidase FAD binding subunit